VNELQPHRPHRQILDEITMRLVDGRMTEGLTFQADGQVYDDAWGAGRWITVQGPDGTHDTLLVTVVRR
jgi:hypothetical protein